MSFNDFFNSNLLPRELERGSLSIVLSGFQLNPNYLAFSMIVIFATSKKQYLRKIIIMTMLAFTGARTALVGGFSLSLLLRRRFGLQFFAIVAVITTSLIIYFYFSGILELITRDLLRIFSSLGENLYIRGIIMNIAMTGSIENFPFGFGLGNFATPSSWHSEVYSDFGVSNLSFFVEKSSSVFDSNVSSILGSTGWFGLFHYFWFTYLTIKCWLVNYTIKIKFMIFFMLFLIGLMLPIFSNISLGLMLALLFRMKHNENTPG